VVGGNYSQDVTWQDTSSLRDCQIVPFTKDTSATRLWGCSYFRLGLLEGNARTSEGLTLMQYLPNAYFHHMSRYGRQQHLQHTSTPAQLPAPLCVYSSPYNTQTM
jgi:hypothetical protein